MVKLLKGRMPMASPHSGVKRGSAPAGEGGSLLLEPASKRAALSNGEGAAGHAASSAEDEMLQAVEQNFDPRNIDKARNIKEMVEGRVCVVRCDFIQVVHDAVGNNWISAEVRAQFKPPSGTAYRGRTCRPLSKPLSALLSVFPPPPRRLPPVRSVLTRVTTPSPVLAPAAPPQQAGLLAAVRRSA